MCLIAWNLYIQKLPETKELYTGTHIMYCTLWEECKQTQCPHRSWRERTKALMWYYSPTKNKLEGIHMIFGFLVDMENTIVISTYSTPWALFLKNDALPLSSLFWSSPTAVHGFYTWDMAVPGLYISCLKPVYSKETMLLYNMLFKDHFYSYFFH